MTDKPRIGTLFNFREGRYRVSGYLKKAEEPVNDDTFQAMLREMLHETSQKMSSDKVRMVACLREEAEYVSGSGICGCIARLDEIEVTGMVPWPEETLAEYEAGAVRRAGTMVD